MNKHKDKRIKLIRAIALAVMCLFFVNNVSGAMSINLNKGSLSVWTISEQPIKQREFIASLYRKNRLIWIANHERYTKLLWSQKTQAAFLPSGKYLVMPETAKDNLLLIRAITYTDFKILIELWEKKEPGKHKTLQAKILGNKEILDFYRKITSFQEGETESENIIFNDLLARAFELRFIIEKNLVYPETDLTEEEKKFIEIMKPLLEEKYPSGRHANFSIEFFDMKKRLKALSSNRADIWEAIGVGGQARAYKKSVTKIKTTKGTFYTRTPITVVKRVTHTHGEDERTFLEHIILKVLDEYFLRESRYTQSHIPWPLGPFDKGYYYQFVEGLEYWPIELMDPDSLRPVSVRIDEFNETASVFSLFGLDITMDLATSDDARVGKNIIHAGWDLMEVYETYRLSKYWQRIDFGYSSFRFDLDKYTERLKTDADVLKKNIGWKYDLIRLIAAKLKNNISDKEEIKLDVLIKRFIEEALERMQSSQPIDVDLVQQAFKTMDKISRTMKLNTFVSKLNGICQDKMDVAKFHFCVPVEILKKSPDIILALNLMGGTREAIPFEMVVTGVTKENIDSMHRLNRTDIRQSLGFPENLDITMIMEEEIRDRAQLLNEDIYDPKIRAGIIKDLFLESTGEQRLPEGEYLAITTNAVAEEEVQKFENEFKQETLNNISILILVDPEPGKSVFSLSKILVDWLKNIQDDNKSAISVILADIISPEEMMKRLDAAVRNAWRVLAAA